MRGEARADSAIAARLLKSIANPKPTTVTPEAGNALLTEREIEVFALPVAQGDSLT